MGALSGIICPLLVIFSLSQVAWHRFAVLRWSDWLGHGISRLTNFGTTRPDCVSRRSLWSGCGFWLISSCRHHLPRDVCHLVGQRYGGRLWGLPPEKLSQVVVFPLLATCWITVVAPITSTLHNPSSSARVMTPSLTLPAVE
jgi:hypothetical protein